MNEPNEKDSVFLEKRRQLLKLGAAGVPMLLTMKASASQPLHSALDCAITIPSGMCIMVGSDGAAWISASFNYDGSKLTKNTVKRFKRASEYVLPAGSIPTRYRPDDTCPTDPCSSGGSGGSDDDEGHWSRNNQQESGFASLLDRLTLTRAAHADDVQYASSWGSGGDDDDNDDGGSNCPTSGGDDDDNHDSGSHHGDSDDGHDDDDGGSSGGGDTSSCDYKSYCVDSATEYPPGTFLDSSGNWNLSGDLGLYTIVAAKYGEYYGTYNNFPGVSCMLSIMTYLNNQ